MVELVQRVRTHHHCDLVAVHDPAAAVLADFQAKASIGFASTSFAELLASGIDFVVLAGPIADRLEQVQEAAAQGAHILVLSPFAPDLATATTMVAICEANEVRLGVLVPEFADPVAEQLRRMLVADWLGGIVCVQAILGDDTRLRGSVTAPSHPFVELVSRHIHLASWLTGRSVQRVTAQTTRSFARDEDGGVATAILRGNVACTFAAYQTTPVRAFAVHGTDGGFRLAGDRLWLRGQREFRGHVFDYMTPGQELAIGRCELVPELTALAPESELVGRFARWIEDTDDFPCPAEQALEDVRVVDALLRAAKSGHTETVG